MGYGNDSIPLANPWEKKRSVNYCYTALTGVSFANRDCRACASGNPSSQLTAWTTLELLQKVRKDDMLPTQNCKVLLSNSLEAQTVFGDSDRGLLSGEISLSIG